MPFPNQQAISNSQKLFFISVSPVEMLRLLRNSQKCPNKVNLKVLFMRGINHSDTVGCNANLPFLLFKSFHKEIDAIVQSTHI